MPNQIISIEPVTLTRQKIIEARMMEFEMADTWFAYRFKFLAEEPQKDDDSLPWVEVDNDFNGIFPRDRFSGIEKHWIGEAKRWKIIISMYGVALDLCIYFKRQPDCEAVFDQLVEYFFGK